MGHKIKEMKYKVLATSCYENDYYYYYYFDYNSRPDMYVYGLMNDSTTINESTHLKAIVLGNKMDSCYTNYSILHTVQISYQDYIQHNCSFHPSALMLRHAQEQDRQHECSPAHLSHLQCCSHHQIHSTQAIGQLPPVPKKNKKNIRWWPNNLAFNRSIKQHQWINANTHAQVKK